MKPKRIVMRWLAALTETDRLISYGILLVTLGVMFYVVAPTFHAQGYLSAWDAGGHLLKAHYFAHELIPAVHFSGWFPTWHGGFDLFQFYPPLLYYILGPLTLVLPPELALRLVTAGLWLALVPVTYYFLRSWHVGRITAAIGASFLLALNASFGLGLGALYGVGLLPNGLGVVLAIFALGRLKRELTWPDRGRRQLVLTGVSFALLVLAHTFSTYWWLLASLILVTAYSAGDAKRATANFRKYGAVLGLGTLLSAYWWVPLVLGIDQMGPTGPLQQGSRWDIFKSLVSAEDSGGVVVSLLAAGGLVTLGWQRRWRALGFFGGLLAATLLLSLNIINGVLPFSSVVASSQYIRFHAFFAWLVMALSVFGLVGVWHLLRQIRVPYLGQTMLGGAVALFLVTVVIPTLREKSGFVRVVDNAPTQELPKVAAYLNQNLRPGEFILSEFNWESRNFFGSPHFVNQRLPLLVDGLWDLDGNFPEGTVGAQKPVLTASVLEQTEYVETQEQYLKSRGVRYIVSTNAETRRSLNQITWLRQVQAEKVLSVYELRGFQTPFGLPQAAAGRVADISFDAPNTYQFNFREPVTIPAGSPLALSYHPWLKFKQGDRKFAGEQDEEQRLVVPEEISDTKNFQIVYTPPVLAQAGSNVSSVVRVLVLIQLFRPQWIERAVSWLRGRWNRRRGRPGR